MLLTVTGFYRTVFKAGLDFIELGFDFRWYLIIKVVKWCKRRAAEVVAAGHAAVTEGFDEVNDSGCDQLHRAGHQAGVRCWQSLPLVGINADAVQPLVCCHLL